MKNELLNDLYKPFENIKEKPGSGKYKYVSSRDVIDRMNRVFEGNWTSEVIDDLVAEDNVLVRVRVYVKDNGESFYHEGYGSSNIARFSFGDKKGQAINIGNNYNSAKSLAIKDACKKWGVALYIEDNPYDEEFVNDGVSTGSPAPSAPKKTLPEVEHTLPNVPPAGNLSADTMEFSPPPFPDEVSKPELVTDTFGNTTPEQTTGVEKITDVQRVAIQGLLELKKLDYKELLINALGRKDNLPASPEDLTYQDAVTVIKYGNNVKK